MSAAEARRLAAIISLIESRQMKPKRLPNGAWLIKPERN